MAVVRFLVVPLLAVILATPLSAPLHADEGLGAFGEIFLRLDFGSDLRDAGPRFGWRLGALPEPDLTDAGESDFTEALTSVLDLSFDALGHGELELVGVRMMEIGGPAAAHAEPAPPQGRGVAWDPGPSPLATAAGPALDGKAVTAGVGELPMRQAAAGPLLGRERWAFHALPLGRHAMGPRFRRLARQLVARVSLRRGNGAVASPAMPAEAAAAPGGRLFGVPWRFHALESVPMMAPRNRREDSIANCAALLFGPHHHARETAAAAPGRAAGLSIGQWTFRDRTAVPAG